MKRVDDGSTSPTMLSRVRDWADHPAWVRFRDTYNPRLRCWCRGYGLDEQAIDEVCQRIWIELACRIRTFEYDPNRMFRGWLRRLCESRVLNFLRQRRAASILSLEERDEAHVACAQRIGIDPAETSEGDQEAASDPVRLLVLGEGEKVQAAVRAKVKPHT